MSRDRNYGWSFVALFLGALAIVILRAPATVLEPSLLFDEGSKVFAYFYERRDAVEILRFKSGYLPLIGNLIGYSVVRLPTRAIPYGFAGSAVVITAATYCLFFLRSFRRWMPSDGNRALICVLFALAPLSDCLLVTMSDYSLWNLLAALILLVAGGPPEAKKWRLIYGAAVNLLIWAHPLTLIVAPLFVWRVFKDRRNANLYWIFLFNLALHQVFGVAGIVTSHGLWDHNTGVQIDVGFATKLFAASWWTLQIVAATAFRTAFGSVWFESAAISLQALFFGWVMLLAATSVIIAWRVPRIRSLAFFLGYLIIAVTFLSCFLRYEDVQNDPLRFITTSPRYIYLQSLAFLLLFATLLTACWQPGKARFWFFPMTVLVGYYYLLNLQLGYSFLPTRGHAGPYDAPDARNGAIVRDFFSELDAAERAHGNSDGIQLTAAKINDWPITINTTTPQPVVKTQFRNRARNLAIMFAIIALGYATRRWWMTLLLNQRRPV